LIFKKGRACLGGERGVVMAVQHRGDVVVGQHLQLDHALLESTLDAKGCGFPNIHKNILVHVLHVK
jgi:hypothetical protein